MQVNATANVEIRAKLTDANLVKIFGISKIAGNLKKYFVVEILGKIVYGK